MVCDEANKKCPVVHGAKYRFAIPFEDPKAFDGTTQEKAMYSAKRDDLGRFILKTLELVKDFEGNQPNSMNH
jgi:hypothetical protein